MTGAIVKFLPRLVLFSVSGATPTLKLFGVNSVTVKHAPLQHIESPMWQSPRTGAASEIVIDQPPPPDSVWSKGTISLTVPICSI